MVELGEVLGSIDWGGIIGKIMLYVGYALFGGIMAIILYSVFHLLSFNIKVHEIELVGSGTEEGLSVGKIRKNRFKWNRHKTHWKVLWPLMNRQEIEPFEDRFVYIGKQVYAFKLGNHYVPGNVNISRKENKLIGSIDPIPHSVREWEAAKIRQFEEEFVKKGFWNENKMLISVMIVALILMAACVATIWLSYKFATQGVDAASSATDFFKSLGPKIIQ